jgi:thymidylate kinase
MIAVLGTDGVGKSTVISSVVSMLSEKIENKLIVKHLRPRLLPTLARLIGKKDGPYSQTVDPHGSTPSSALVSLLRLGYLSVDYILGYWLLVHPLVIKQSAVVLFDRYAYDMALDPHRFRIGLGGSLVWWFTRLAPKPDLVVCLHAPPEVIANRKQELPIDEIRRQVEALQAFARGEPRALLVSTEGSIEEVRERVLQILQEYFYIREKNVRMRG